MSVSQMFCQQCDKYACVRTRNGLLTCLYHYNILEEVTSTPDIVNKDSLDFQFEGLKDLWKESICDVMLAMFEAQSKEQELYQKDPLAMLAMNAPRLITATKKQAVETSKLQKRKQNEKKGEIKTIDSIPLNSLQKKIRHENLWIAARKHKSVVSDNSASTVNIFGDLCTRCKSDNTKRQYNAGYHDNAKNETWVKTVTVHRVICSECSHVEVFED